MTMDLISRRTLFGNAERSSFSISPDGELLAFVAPRDGVRNIWVARRDAPDAGKPVTCDTHRGIASYQWTRDGRHVLFSMDNDGDEKWRVFIACVTTGAVRNLTPVDADRAYVVATSMGDPHHIVIGVHARDPRYADLYRVNLASGAAHLLEENPGFDEYLLGDDLNPRIATRTDLDGTMTILRRTADAAWEPWLTFDPAEAATSRAMGLDRAGRTLFMLDSRGHDTLALVSIDLADGTLATIAQDDRYDLGGYVGSWETFHPIAYVVTRQHRQTVPLTDGMARDVATIDAAGIGSWGITSRSDDDRWWTIGADSDVRPGLGYLYDRHGGTLHLLYETRPALRDAPLARMYPLSVPARDGLALDCYLTLPHGEPDPAGDAARTKLPMVVLVHGGPWTRDSFGYDPEHQWLANRGYAVLSVNFRGSTGFGKRFVAAGDGEWGAAMSDDVDAAVDAVVARGICDPARLAIMGASYGGYAVLTALTRTPERYACGVDIVGPSNLETLIEAMPPHWEAARAQLYRALGDPTTERGRALLRDRSPLHRASRIVRPLLIAQGRNDPRVPMREAEQMVDALKRHDIPVGFVVYGDEGHGFVRPANRISSIALTEAFLARWIGGRCEPTHDDEIAGTTCDIVEGADLLPGQVARAG